MTTTTSQLLAEMFPPAATAVIAILGTVILVLAYFVLALYKANSRLHSVLKKQIENCTPKEIDLLIKVYSSNDNEL